MNIVHSLATFAVIFPAELPDKSMFAAVVMGTKYRWLPVWVGLAGAFLAHVVIAVSAGGVISLLPHTVVAFIVGTCFAVGAWLMFRNFEQGDQAEETEKSIGSVDATSNKKIAATAFGIVFVSEWGDLTQIATINLSARYDDPLGVAIGAIAALWLVTGLGVLLGRKLVRTIPMKLVRRIAGTVLLALSIWSFVDFGRALAA